MKDIFDAVILAVDDEPELLEMLTEILMEAGFRNVVTGKNCREARSVFFRRMPDVVLLDVMLPDGDGFTLFQELREKADVPVLFLSAKDEDESRLLGLGLGADDYITKPFLPRELILRLKAVLRRVYGPGKNKPEQRKEIRLAGTRINWGSGTVDAGRGEQTLTAKEYALLKKLYDNKGNIVTVDSLCHAAWGDEIFGYENTLMVHIRRLREKIEADPSQPKLLLTVRGLGYKLTGEESR